MQGAQAFLHTLEHELRRDPGFHHLFTNRIVDDVAAMKTDLAARSAPLYQVRGLKPEMFELGDDRASTFP